MNSINFLGRSSFPWSSDTFDFSQNMFLLAAELGKLGGATYILSGCVETGMDVASGVVVINGEILPFSGGIRQDSVYIKQTKRSVNPNGYNFPDVYTTRTVEFGIGTEQFNWADFKNIQTNQQLAKAIEDLKAEIETLRGIPAGIIAMWSGSTDNIPAGWSLCNGENNTPNLSGRFIVGYNINDPDYDQVGKTAGLKEVKLTADQNGEHDHDYEIYATGSADNNRYSNKNNTDSDKNTVMKTAKSGKGLPHENRPPYFVLAYIIKQ